MGQTVARKRNTHQREDAEIVIASELAKDPALGPQSDQKAEDGGDEQEPGQDVHRGSATALHIPTHGYRLVETGKLDMDQRGGRGTK